MTDEKTPRVSNAFCRLVLSRIPKDGTLITLGALRGSMMGYHLMRDVNWKRRLRRTIARLIELGEPIGATGDGGVFRIVDYMGLDLATLPLEVQAQALLDRAEKLRSNFARRAAVAKGALTQEEKP